MFEQRKVLRALLAGEPFIAADCFSALTGRIVQKVGFKAAYMGGHATSMMHLAIPDCGTFTTTEMIDLSARVAEAIDIPLIADADQAGEAIVEMYRAIKRYDRVGVAGVHIEDEIAPKHSAWDGPLLPIEEMAARISAACEARTDPDFVIIVRSDELYRVGGGGTGSLDEAIRRGVAYAEAGADVFLPTFATEEQLARITAEVPVPVAGYGKLLEGLQLSLGGGSTAVAAAAVFKASTYLFEHGEIDPSLFENAPDMSDLIDQPLYDGVVRSWTERTGRPLRSAPEPAG
jgi:2-methylisocitrate lyase-like PEP mutase family enzyme